MLTSLNVRGMLSCRRTSSHSLQRVTSSRRTILMSSVDSNSGTFSQYMELVSSTNDRVKLLKSLHTKKKRDTENLLLLEGHRQVIDAINGGYVPSILLFSEEAASAPLGTLLLDALRKCAPSTICRASNELIQSISDTVNCQGVIAAFPKPEKLTKLPLGESSLIVLMDRPADPGNLGTIIRTAYGMGVDAVIIADGCEPWSPKVLRSAMGMCLKLPIFEASWANNGISDLLLKRSETFLPYQILLADADPSAHIYHKVDMTGPTVIVVGSEAFG